MIKEQKSLRKIRASFDGFARTVRICRLVYCLDVRASNFTWTGRVCRCPRVSRKVKLGAKHVSGRIGELCGSEHVVLDRV